MTELELKDELLDQLIVGLIVFGDDGRILRRNNAARQILSADTMLDQSAERQRGRQRIIELANRARRERRQIRARAVRAGHELIDIYCSVLSDGNVLVELLPVHWHAQQAAAREAQQRDAGLNAMLQGFAHEVRNPLSGMKGAMQLLMRGDIDDSERDCCRVVMEEIVRVERLIERMRAEDSDHQPFDEINAHFVTDRVVALSASRDEVHFVRDYDPSVPNLWGASDALIQALLNLVNNAIDAGASRIVVRTRTRPGSAFDGDPNQFWAVLSVIDNGPGVKEEVRDILFFPMVSGRPLGSGLGLAIAQRIARAHGGFLRLVDRQGGGAHFDLWLPLRLDAAPADHEPAAESAP